MHLVYKLLKGNPSNPSNPTERKQEVPLKIPTLFTVSFILFISGCGDLDSSSPDEKKIRLGPCPEFSETEQIRKNSPSSEERASIERDRRNRYISEEWGFGFTLDRESEEEILEISAQSESESESESENTNDPKDDMNESSNETLKFHWRIYADHYFQLFFKISGNWIEYRDPFGDDLYQLPEGRKIRLTDEVSGKITCGDQDCLKLNISLEQNEKSASIQIVRLPMQALGRQLLKGCEVPIFFKYEREQFLEDSSELQRSFKTLESIDTLSFDLTHVRSWNDEEASSIAIKASSRIHTLLSLGTPEAAEHGRLFVEEDHGISFKAVRYRLTQAGDRALLDDLKFMFKTTKGNDICYQILFIPETIREGY
jgi:hypothetical protein